MARRPTPAFLSKIIEKERIDFIQEKRIEDFNFMPLLKGLCDEYKIDFDLKMAMYYRSLIIRCGTEIYDMQCLDTNMPPVYP